MSKKYPNMLEKYQQEIGVWSFEQFGKSKGKSLAQHNLIDTNDPLMGMVEELGELHHAVLKQKQQIRTAEDHEKAEKDAIGDLMIYLLDYCSRRGFSTSEILKDTWENVVKKRDWAGDPVQGKILNKLDQDMKTAADRLGMPAAEWPNGPGDLPF